MLCEFVTIVGLSATGPTKRLNEQVNRKRLPQNFLFQLTVAEKAEVVANCDHLPYEFDNGKRQDLTPLIPLNADVAKRLTELEMKTESLDLSHDTFSRNTRLQLRKLLDAVHELTTPSTLRWCLHHHASTHIGKENKERLAQGQEPDWGNAKRRQKDLDATHTKKHGKSSFGYKLSVSVDLKHCFIRNIATGTASEHDGHHCEKVLDEHNTGRDVYADKAYPSRRRQEMLKVLGWRDDMQRKASKDSPLSECQKRRNRKIASKRAKVEHVFAGIRHLGGKFIRAIGQTRADAAMTMMAACYNIKRQAMFMHKGVDPFYKSARA